MSNQGCRAVEYTESWTHSTVSPAGFQEHRMQRGLQERVGFELVLEGCHSKCRREGEKAFQNGPWHGSI